MLPYCGAPPSPDALWSRWNIDPVLCTVLAIVAVAYAAGSRQLGRDERVAFYSGWAITAAALISPFCALSVSLFAARVGQHMILALLAAPLVAAGRPVAAFGALLRDRKWRTPINSAPILAAVVFTALLWFWHSPAPYQATFSSTLVYWSMHLSLFGAALWLWSELLDPAPGRLMPVLLAGVISSVQMGLLGALITFAPRPLFAPHALTTAAWGLTPLQDQQLGGGLMWVPGCLVFLVAAMLVLWSALARADWKLARPARLGMR